MFVSFYSTAFFLFRGKDKERLRKEKRRKGFLRVPANVFVLFVPVEPCTAFKPLCGFK